MKLLQVGLTASSPSCFHYRNHGQSNNVPRTFPFMVTLTRKDELYGSTKIPASCSVNGSQDETGHVLELAHAAVADFHLAVLEVVCGETTAAVHKRQE
ncbi:hypothetical protein Aduo_008152 [Ancylostoma duodenale]